MYIGKGHHLAILCKFVLPGSFNGYNGYNGYNWGWPSARLFGWSAADWSRPATNKSISSERKRKSLLFCWERKSWTSWLLTCCSKKGWVAEKSSKKGVNRKEKCFLSSQTRWSWQIKRACTSFWTCSSSLGHWSHTQEPSSSHAAASTFKVCARKLTCTNQGRVYLFVAEYECTYIILPSFPHGFFCRYY